MANQKGFAHILILVLLLAGVGAGVYLVQTKTSFLPKAYNKKSTSTPISHPITPTPTYIIPTLTPTPTYIIPTLTLTPTPTQSLVAPSISSVTIENSRDNCIVGSQGPESNRIRISWTNSATPVMKVLISKTNPFSSIIGWYRKRITTEPYAATSTTGPAGFIGVNGSVNDQNLIVKPDETIYIRLGIDKDNELLGSVYTFKARKCPS